MAYCPHCMQRVTGGKSCPHCKKPLNQTEKENHLPVGHVLQSNSGRRYAVGLARGQGGFGITYVAIEQQTKQRVAIKEYFPVRCADRGSDHVRVVTKPGMEKAFRGGMESFIKEGTLLFQLNTLPCVVHVQDWFTANATAYLVMEFLDGAPLHSLVVAERRIPAKRLMPLLAPLLRDLQQLHEADIIHRDIAPDNIMLMPDGTLKLLDFGSARAMENNKSMTVMLKHGFTPIEQYMSHGKQGAWTDIYALSATFYYCLTGVLPPSAPDRLYDENALRPLGSLHVDGLLPQEEAALMAGLRVQPTARPRSAEAFAAMLPRRGLERATLRSLLKPNASERKEPERSAGVEAKGADVRREKAAAGIAASPPKAAPSALTAEELQTRRYKLWRNILLASVVLLSLCLIAYLATARAEASSLRLAPGGIPSLGWKGAIHHV